MQKLFDAFMRAANIASAEHALLERSIGSAVLDKLRGHTSLFSQHYRAKGGSEPMTLDMLAKMDEGWYDADLSVAEQYIVPDGVSFAEAYHAWDIPGHELALVERTIGRGILDQMRGGTTPLLEIYDELGGTNPGSQEIFASLGEAWGANDVTHVLEKLV